MSNNQSSSSSTRPFPSGFLPNSLVGRALLAGAVVSGSLLAGAHIFEAFGYDPCALCLDQRAAHWTAIVICLIGLIKIFGFKAHKLAAAAIGAAALVYGFSALLSLYHTGVEFKFWPGPTSCSGNGTISDITDLSGGFDTSKPRVSCGEAAWRFLGISMAGYNFLASIALFALSLFATLEAIKSAKKNHWPKIQADQQPVHHPAQQAVSNTSAPTSNDKQN